MLLTPNYLKRKQQIQNSISYVLFLLKTNIYSYGLIFIVVLMKRCFY